MQGATSFSSSCLFVEAALHSGWGGRPEGRKQGGHRKWGKNQKGVGEENRKVNRGSCLWK